MTELSVPLRFCWLRLRRHTRTVEWGQFNVWTECGRCGHRYVVGVNHGGPR